MAVDEAGRLLLAGAGLAGEQHRHHRARGAQGLAQRLAAAAARGDHPGEVGERLDGGGELGGARGEALGGAFGVERDHVAGAATHGFAGRLERR